MISFMMVILAVLARMISYQKLWYYVWYHSSCCDIMYDIPKTIKKSLSCAIFMDSLVLSFFGFAFGAVVGVGESSARVWAFRPRCQDLSAWLVRDGLDGAILLLRLLLRVGYVEKAWNDRFVATLVWSFSPAWEAVELTPLRGGRHDGAEGAISTKQYTCLHWEVNEAIYLSVKV